MREDVATLERVHDLDKLETLMLRLPELVGSPLSVNALREDLGVCHRSVRKEQKHHHLGCTLVPDLAQRLENLVACHLLKWVHHQQDTAGRDLDLRYYRERESREVDFVVVDRLEPILLVETQLGDDARDRNLRYLEQKCPDAEAWSVGAVGTKDYVTEEGIRVAPAVRLLGDLV